MIIKVEGIWKALCFITNSYKEGKETILGNNDEMITKIDDNLLTVNNILGSKYVGPIKPRVEVQAKMLRYVQDLIDEWYLHQKNWIYLEPILKSPFAMKNLPRETSLFNQIDSKWKHIMKQAKDSINIRRYADEYISHYTIKILKANNETFEVVQKTLENFLEKKRDIFQRFYFLSND
jgi:dynein heavy chain